MPSSRKPWTRDELIIAIHLYARLHFGLFHSKQPLVVEVEDRMGRTPGSVAETAKWGHVSIVNLPETWAVDRSKSRYG